MEQNYLIMGLPGSGKGTFCHNLKAKGYHIIAMGERLRHEVKAQTVLGKRVKQNVDTGVLIPDDLAFAIIVQEIRQAPRPFAIEGFPSTIPQYQLFRTFLKNQDQNITVIHLECPEKIARERIVDRLTCCDCSFIYNRKSHPPRQENQCDHCGGVLFHRPEDTLACAEKRIQAYNDKTFPIVHLAKEDFPFTKINVLQYTVESVL